MKATVKFKFHLKNGKVFECIEELSKEQIHGMLSTIKTSFKEGVSAVLFFEDCCVRLSECAVVEWEELFSEP